MGLTVYYDLDLPGGEPESRARELVEALHEAAQSLGVEQVTAVRRILPADCERLEHEKLDLDWLVRCFAERGVEDPRAPERLLTVLPGLAYGFGGVIGRCEPVILGLARYPRVVADAGDELQTGLTRWSWRACTTTQYASLVSLSHFVESHQRLIALLDAARHLGFVVAARDDSGYWEHRDQKRLVESVEQWNARVAGIAGRIADSLDGAGPHKTAFKVEAPIFRHSRFEQLESQR